MGHEHAVKNGKWQPWGMEIKIPMREVRNPVALIKKKGGFSVKASVALNSFVSNNNGSPFGEPLCYFKL